VTPDQAFLQAIREDLDADAPRRVYADWLEEQGQAERADRAQLIRYQVALASGMLNHTRLTRARLQDLERREQALLAKHREAWERPLRQLCGNIHLTWSRGFPARVLISAADFVRHGAELLALAPIHSARIVMVSGEQEARALAQAPHLSLLTTLDLNWTGIRAAGAQALATSPHVSNLSTLRLAYGLIGNEGLAAVAASAYLGRLTVLDLHRNRIGDSGVTALAESLHFTHLAELDLSWNWIGLAGAQALAGSPRLGNLNALSLDNNDIGDEGARALAASPYLRRLTVLNLASSGIGDDGARALLRSLRQGPLKHVRQLHLSHNAISQDLRADIEKALQANRRREYGRVPG
jgi:uncharacterized protein (TIGR02996 family)